MFKAVKIFITLILLIALIGFCLVGFAIFWAKDDFKKVPTNIVTKIEDALEALSPNLQVYVGSAETKFIDFEKGFEFILTDSYIQLGSEVLASTPRMRMELKLKDLMFLDVKFGKLRLYNPEFVVTNNTPKTSQQSDKSSLLKTYRTLIYGLFSAIDKENNVIPVDKIDLEGAKISLNNNGEYETWDLRLASLKFFKLQNSTYLQTDIQTEIHNSVVYVSSKTRLLEGSRMVADVEFSNLPSKIFSVFLQDIEWLKDLDLNLSGVSKIIMNRDSIESSISLETGFTFNKKDLGDVELKYNGILNLDADEDNVVSPTLTSNILLKNLEMKKLRQLWPKGYGDNIRDEVLNRASNGIYEEVTVSLQFGFDDLNFNSVLSEKYSISGKVKGADILFNEKYPKIQNVEGKFEFDGDNVTGELKTANIKNKLILIDSTLNIKNINAKESLLEIKGKMNGDIMAVKHIIKAAMKGKDAKYFYNTRKIKAIGSGSYYYLDDINDGFNYIHTKLKVDAKLKELEVENLVDGINFTSNNASLESDENGINIAAKGLVNTSPGEVEVWVGYKKSDHYKIKANAVANNADMSAIVKNYDDYIDGDTKFEFEYNSEGNTNSIIGNLDFEKAKIDFPYISWNKKPDEFATLSFTGRNADFKALDIKSLRLTTKNSASTGRAIIPLEKHAPLEVYFKSLQIGKNDAEIYYSESNIKDKKGKNLGSATIININGKSFDGSKLIETINNNSTNRNNNSGLTLTAKLDRLIMSENINIKDFTANLKCGFNNCLSGSAKGGFESSGAFNMLFYKNSDEHNPNQRIFELETDNAGVLVKALGISDNIKDGYIKIESVTDPNAEYKTMGTILAQNYQIVKAPVLAKIFSLASFSGISELLTGSGIPMKRLNGNFAMNDDFIAFRDVTSSGDSLGITAQGRYNLKTSHIDLSGAVTPSYSVNSFLGRIPILGKIFTASEGEGLIAAKYSVKGKSPKVDVSVNPLSALTPGFLRRIWGNSSTDINIDKNSKDDRRRKFPSAKNK